MLRLVDVTEDGQWVRRRIAVDEIPAELATAVAALVDARLVQRDDEQIDVVHEVVFRAWPLLATWLDDARSQSGAGSRAACRRPSLGHPGPFRRRRLPRGPTRCRRRVHGATR